MLIHESNSLVEKTPFIIFSLILSFLLLIAIPFTAHRFFSVLKLIKSKFMESSRPRIVSKPLIPPAQRISSLDGLRGLTVFFVFYSHYLSNVDAGLYTPWIQVFSMGVPIFFTLSGLLISISYQPTRDLRGVLAFYLRRLFRTYPLYFLLVMLAFFHHQFSVEDLFSYLTFSFGITSPHVSPNYIGIIWSLFCEEVFYLLFPIIFLICRNWLSSILFLAFIVFIEIYSRTLLNQHTNLLFGPGSSFLSNFHFFIGGILLFRLKDTGFLDFYAAFSRKTHRLLTEVVFLFAFVFFLYIGIRHYAVFATFSISLLALFTNSFTSRLFQNPSFVFIGQLCYPIYLIHNIIAFSFTRILLERLPPPLVYFSAIFELLIILSISFCLSKFIEIPLQKIGKRFSKLLSPLHRDTLTERLPSTTSMGI